MTFGALFPGQGSQFVGMGEDLFAKRPDLLGDRANSILGWSLRDLCLQGPESELTRTEHAQPALFALSYALWEEFADAVSIRPAGAAGHSLGEYTALTAAGSLDFDSALALVSRRGEAMASAADLEPSGMAALLGADVETAEAIATRRRDEGGRLQVANINAPGQVVLAGGAADIDWVVENARDLGVRRAIPLKVAGAFHSEFMESARTEVASALSKIDVSEPVFPVWSNTTARPHTRALVSETLARQVVSPVRFSESLRNMASAGMDTFVHVGPGDVTGGMAKRTVDDVRVVVVSSVADIAVAAEAVGTMGRSEPG